MKKKGGRDGSVFCFSAKPYVCSYTIGVVSAICTFVGRTGTNAQAHTFLVGSDCEVQAGVPWAGECWLENLACRKEGKRRSKCGSDPFVFFVCVGMCSTLLAQSVVM